MGSIGGANFEKNPFLDQNEENFEDFDKNSKIDIFQICMKYFLDFSLLQRYIPPVFLISDGWDIPASPLPDELKYL